MTTTAVLTTTLTGLAADRPDLTGPGSHSARRIALVAAMLAGAVGGSLLVLHASPRLALGMATTILAAVASPRGALLVDEPVTAVGRLSSRRTTRPPERRPNRQDR